MLVSCVTNVTGSTKYFEYHCYEGEDSNDAELWHHTHQKVKVLHELTDIDEEVGKIYRIRFPDGFEYDVFEDELLNTPSEYERPPYESDIRRNDPQEVEK
jgi:hypothetical protein